MPEEINIAWTGSPDRPAEAHYTVNGAAMGVGDAGFDNVLAFVRDNPGGKLTVRLGALPLTGEDLHGALPFRERFAELEALVAPGHIAFDLGGA